MTSLGLEFVRRMIQEPDFLNEMIEDTLKVFGTETHQGGHIIAVPMESIGASIVGTSAPAGAAPAPRMTDH